MGAGRLPWLDVLGLALLGGLLLLRGLRGGRR